MAQRLNAGRPSTILRQAQDDPPPPVGEERLPFGRHNGFSYTSPVVLASQPLFLSSIIRLCRHPDGVRNAASVTGSARSVSAFGVTFVLPFRRLIVRISSHSIIVACSFRTFDCRSGRGGVDWSCNPDTSSLPQFRNHCTRLTIRWILNFCQRAAAYLLPPDPAHVRPVVM